MRRICCAYVFPKGDFCLQFAECKNFKFYILDEEGEAESLYIENVEDLTFFQKVELLKKYSVEGLLCGMIPAKEKEEIEKIGIQVYDGLRGRADRAVLSISHGHFQEELEIMRKSAI